VGHADTSRWYDWPVYLAVRIVICVVQALPLSFCQRACSALAWLCCGPLGVRRELIEDNLRHAFPRLTAAQRQLLARQMWEHLFLMVVEVAHTPRKIHETNWRDYITLVEARRLVGALLDDRPTVLVSGHYGNFELSSYLLGLLGFPSHSIARPLDNRYLDRFVNRFRASSGQYIFPKDGSGQAIDALLARGGTLALLADQHAGPKGCWVEFFGRPASTHKAIALFSLGNDAPLVVCFCRRQGRPLHHLLGAQALADPRHDTELASVPALTHWYTRALEEIIRAAPEQYWWLHRRWRDPKPRTRAPQPRAA
jgi:KDO2-lipid IV(A) lauroyltransferase